MSQSQSKKIPLSVLLLSERDFFIPFTPDEALMCWAALTWASLESSGQNKRRKLLFYLRFTSCKDSSSLCLLDASSNLILYLFLRLCCSQARPKIRDHFVLDPMLVQNAHNNNANSAASNCTWATCCGEIQGINSIHLHSETIAFKWWDVKEDTQKFCPSHWSRIKLAKSLVRAVLKSQLIWWTTDWNNTSVL